MTYKRFEQLVIGIGGIAILGTAFLSRSAGFDPYEFAAQFLLLLVVVGAAHWGRKGGAIAAAIASFAYVAIRVPLIVDAGGLTTEILVMLLARIAAFGIIGILGGEICGRVKYLFATLEGASAVDEWSGVYNQRYASRQLGAAIARCRRYEEPFSAVLVELSSALMQDLKASRQRSIVRGVANLLRNDVRMVDEVARLDDGRFILLLPHTPKAGGIVVAERIAPEIRRLVGARDEAVRTTVLGGMEDAAELEALDVSIAPPLAETDQAPSTE